MSQSRSDSGFDLGRVFEPDPAHADGLCHGREIRILKLRAGGEEARRLLFELDETERAVVENDDLHGQAQLRQAQEIAHQHGEPAVTR